MVETTGFFLILRMQKQCFKIKVMKKQRSKLRRDIYELVDYIDSNGDGKKNFDWYDLFMLVVIIFSLIPLLYKKETEFFRMIDIVTVSIFIVDYVLRWLTADFRMKKRGIGPFILYPFTLYAIIDLLSIIPSLSLFSNAWRALKLFRIFKTVRILRTVKVVRLAKIMRYSSAYDIIIRVLKKSKAPLIAVVNLAVGYIIISALIIFNVEPDSFENFFEAIYWATISLTTVGYGDIYPTTTIGRLVAMVSSVFGIAIVALPAGIITAGYMEAIREKHEKQNRQ